MSIRMGLQWGFSQRKQFQGATGACPLAWLDTCMLLLLGGAFMTPSLRAQPSLSLPFPGQPLQHLPCASSRNENDQCLRLTMIKVGWETCTAGGGIWGTLRGIFCNTAVFQWITLYTAQCIWGDKIFGIVNIQETLIEFALEKAPHLPQDKRIAKIASLPSGVPQTLSCEMSTILRLEDPTLTHSTEWYHRVQCARRGLTVFTAHILTRGHLRGFQSTKTDKNLVRWKMGSSFQKGATWFPSPTAATVSTTTIPAKRKLFMVLDICLLKTRTVAAEPQAWRERHKEDSPGIQKIARAWYPLGLQSHFNKPSPTLWRKESTSSTGSTEPRYRFKPAFRPTRIWVFPLPTKVSTYTGTKAWGISYRATTDTKWAGRWLPAPLRMGVQEESWTVLSQSTVSIL